jgi:16S rRNA (cytosine967-C5)-methyltransferase
MAPVSPARKAAFVMLMELERGGAHSDELLRGKRVNALPEADRRLTTALILGTLRWQIDLDRRIRSYLKHPSAKLDAEVLIPLRLGAFQLLHMDRIPARAAIDESVELVKQAGHRFASRMVNAVLRKLTSQTEQVDQEATDSREGHPAWMVERWTSFYGDEAAGTICRYGQEQPTLSLRVSGEAAKTELVAAGVVLEPGEFLSAARRVVSGDVTNTAAFREGAIRMQDEGSQMIAELVPRGKRILDCCAAPGGKTLILAERNPDAEIEACDGSQQRLAELRKRVAVLGERVQCRLKDVTGMKDESAFEVVLADVPCSGTGTLGRNPEIRHRLRIGDFVRQAERQKAILRSALRAVCRGGHVVYSTCSLEPEENEQVVAAVLSEFANAHVAPLQKRIGELRSEGILTEGGADRLMRCITAEGSLRLVPGEFHTDGFFAALIAKQS